MKLLAINTASILSAALFDEDRLVAEENFLEKDRYKAEDLPVLLEQLFSETGWRPEEITHVAAATGPGGYTGIRSGLTFAKTLAQMRNIPLVGVNTLEAMASLSPNQGLVLPLLDAKMKEINWGLFSPFEKGGLRGICALSSLDQILEELTKIDDPVTLLGTESLPAARAAIEALLQERALFPEAVELHYPLARGVGLIALSRIHRGELLTWQELEPSYARPPVLS